MYVVGALIDGFHIDHIHAITQETLIMILEIFDAFLSENMKDYS